MASIKQIRRESKQTSPQRPVALQAPARLHNEDISTPFGRFGMLQQRHEQRAGLDNLRMAFSVFPLLLRKPPFATQVMAALSPRTRQR